MIRSILDYGDVLYPVISLYESKRLEYIQREASLICTRAYLRTLHTLVLRELGWEDLNTRRKYHCLLLMYKIMNRFVPSYLSSQRPPLRHENVHYALRNEHDVVNFYYRYNPFKNSFFPCTIKTWNSLSVELKNATTLNIFRLELSKGLIPCKSKLFSEFYGKASINHTRMRLGLSA